MKDALLLLIAERDENTCRKAMTPSEQVAIGKAIEEIEAPEAAKRKAAHLKQGEQIPVREPVLSRENKGKTSNKVGEALGVSGKTYEQTK